MASDQGNPDECNARQSVVAEGIQHLKANQLPEAESCLRAALGEAPEDLEALYSLGSLCYRTDRLREARSLIEAALRIDPHDARALCGLGAIHHRQGNIHEAIDCLTRSTSLQPDNADAQTNLGLLLKENGRSDEATSHLELALELNPRNSSAARLLGVIQGEKGDYASALKYLRLARDIDPFNVDCLLDLGLNYWIAKDTNGAYSAFTRVIELDPENILAHLNLSMVLLQSGERFLGWEFYEWRLHASRPSPLLIQANGERWDGAPNADIKLLLISEQGLGDVLQFIRLAPLIRSRVASVALCVQQKLIPLIEQAGLVDQMFDPTEAIALEGYHWLPLLSVPRLLSLQNSPAESCNQTYLRADKSCAERWKAKFSSDGSLKIGLHWQGNPEAEQGILSGRSIPLELLSPLAELSGVTFLSLQKGAGTEQLESCSFRDSFIDLQDEITSTMSFTETAAILESCDLVITTDTALAHLSGGLGRPTWLLLHQVPDWRWGLRGERTHWYPSMRLFRQRRPHDWPEVIRRVKRSLIGMGNQ
ncbi:tetratricopeptide repeat protein [Synechococcus sp. CS-1332]|uniref:tetratricopeptide repeat protein n=1 Tax=Synechococcus sp. CS-1332 TaxID=2847972 RepID=UPI00223ADED7|nr:tetratricopeptide repeat protein [Synechococcus sp. CS-1332]MCT0207777.1 tetratricopeptide repeat protein [Synechococcus sp. CS-1332]